MIQILMGQKVTARATFSRVKGSSYPTAAESRKAEMYTPATPPVWTVSDKAVALITPSADGMSCEVGGFMPGIVKISVTGDGLTATEMVEINEYSVAITFDEPTPNGG